MAESSKIPRASIAITILDDDEYIDMMMEDRGPCALGVYVALICAAKAQRNQGVFKMDVQRLARSVKMNVAPLQKGLNQLLKFKWLLCPTGDYSEGLEIAGFAKWNPSWGGKREGAGRKKNQTKSSFSSGAPSSSSSSSSSSSLSKHIQEGACEFSEIWKEYPRKEGEEQARQCWLKYTPEEQAECIFRAPAFSIIWRRGFRSVPENKSYCPSGHVFFKDKRWKDDLRATWDSAHRPHAAAYPFMLGASDVEIAVVREVVNQEAKA